MDNLIALTDINISVPRNNNIIIDSLRINIGDVIQIKAPSGRGKSFFYHTLLGMTEASKTLYRDDLHLSKLFCYCPAYLSFFSDTVIEELQRIYAAESEIQALIKHNIMDSSFLHQKCRDLSSGQNQLLVFIRAILSKKPILIFDELTNAMDFELKLKVNDYIFNYLLKNKAIIFSIHESSVLVPNKTINLSS